MKSAPNTSERAAESAPAGGDFPTDLFALPLRAPGAFPLRSKAPGALRSRAKKEYAETAAALAEKQELSTEEAAEVSQLWRKLVKLFHPDRFAHEPEKQETYHKLTAAINHAKDRSLKEAFPRLPHPLRNRRRPRRCRHRRQLHRRRRRVGAQAR